MLGRNWQFHGSAVYKVQSGAVEDFSVVFENGKFTAYFTSGDSLQNQRLCTAISDSPFGPFTDTKMSIPSRTHTRLYRNRIDSSRRIITQVWPGLPKAGIWLHTDFSEELSMRELLIEPEAPYDIAAANPGIFKNPDGDIDIAWEGRSKKIEWSLYVGALHPDGSTTIDKRAICDGANPSYLLYDGIVYMYFSKWVGKGFETWVMHQNYNG